MGTPKNSAVTRAKIIEAAGQLFAERGFKGVTVRDIVQKADSHLSALNYHFKTKEALYHEVVLEACATASVSEQEKKLLLRLEPREALLLLTKEALRDYTRQSENNWQIVIINRECWEPSAVFNEVAQEYFKPETDFLAGIVGKIVDQPADSLQVRFAVISLFGLLETFGLYGHLIEAVAPGLQDHFQKKDRISKQLVHLVIEAASQSPRG